MKKILLVTGILGSVALASVFAYQGNPGVENPDCTDPERHAEVEQMFENLDYDSFQTLYEGKGVMNKIDSEEEFEKFAEMRDAYASGDTETGDELKEELGLGLRPQDGSGQGKGRRGGQGMGTGDCDGTGSMQGRGQGRGQGRNR